MKMERRKNLIARKTCFWFVVIMQLAMFTKAANVTDTIQIEDTELYAWSAWGSWSECSRTCGGGVAVQTRQCLPRSNKSANNISEAITRVARHAHDCLGLSRRYHECNTKPCAGEQQDMRAVQCSTYDKRPFRGRFYIWVPYIDGDSPCTLNCRPTGQQFYASLSLVRDGTPCTKPGYRAVCVQGTCKGEDVFRYCCISGYKENKCTLLINIEPMWNYDYYIYCYC